MAVLDCAGVFGCWVLARAYMSGREREMMGGARMNVREMGRWVSLCW